MLGEPEFVFAMGSGLLDDMVVRPAEVSLRKKDDISTCRGHVIEAKLILEKLILCAEPVRVLKNNASGVIGFIMNRVTDRRVRQGGRSGWSGNSQRKVRARERSSDLGWHKGWIIHEKSWGWRTSLLKPV